MTPWPDRNLLCFPLAIDYFLICRDTQPYERQYHELMGI
jgi:hypothetical protein